ncbi:formimidoylglutamase [Marivirga harenae]|uniref:formimidoylglutamase n=1 Tax=Marivirga harenae TaxID=2010992 RepID=UPI0026DFAA52|nr:formimidoylglutamase [Marivirga harenae]WKV12031.1 formimidoylglutamase [Marivirga harenae]|tara:strand:+ start:134971 stop:135963 length:993 start_codon:yes stop_codon:yes gene_type:complete
MDIKHFHFFDEQDLHSYLKPREGETKIGEKIAYGNDFKNSTAKFVLLGIEESIGVKGNLGVSGTHTAWNSFLTAFLNSQHTYKLNGESIHLLGNFNFQQMADNAKFVDDFRKLVPIVDVAVYPLIQEISAAGKIPIVIGGSHANAFPIIKAVSLAKNKAINVINLDAHADFRALEGRHSGNPFSNAKAKGYMADYSILGLHENYNSQNMLDEMAKHKGIRYFFWEDIYLRKKITFEEALLDFIQLNQNKTCGIELDTDSIEGVLSSAMTPSGFSTTNARYYVYQTSHNLHPSYFHICEAATELETGLKDNSTGKLLSYLVSDFVKGFLES